MDHVEHFRQALQVAWESPDPSTQVGAVIVNQHGGVLGEGCNEFPMGVRYTEERLQRPLKYSFIEHAERNAIFDMLRNGRYDRGLVMYALWAACADCASAIIQTGIRTVYTHEFYTGDTHWSDSTRVAFEMFAEAGVQVFFVNDQVMLPGETVRFNGEQVHY